MMFSRTCLLMTVLSLMFLNGQASTQEEPLCVENSPERRGEIGCSLIDTKLLPANLKEPVCSGISTVFKTGNLRQPPLALRAWLSRRTGLGG